MKIALFGATGRTGRLVLDQALAAGHTVTALARTPDALPAHERLSVVKGGMHDGAAIDQVVAGADAAISCLGTVNRKPNTELSDATRLILARLAAAGVERSVWVTSIGCGDSLPQLRSFVFRELIVKRLAKNIWADKDRQEAAIAESAGAWTIVRPGGLTDKEPTGAWTVIGGGDAQPTRIMIPRADLAAMLLAAAQDPALARKTVCVFG